MKTYTQIENTETKPNQTHTPKSKNVDDKDVVVEGKKDSSFETNWLFFSRVFSYRSDQIVRYI